AEAGPAPPPPAARAPFVGRGRHLQTLRDAFDALSGGQTVTVHVYGRSGVGKSHLVERFFEGLGKLPDVLLPARPCYEAESVPYKALDSLMDALSRFLTRLPPEEVRGLLPTDVAALARLFPVLRRVRAIAEARAAGQVPDVHELRRRAFAALRTLLTR